MSPESHIPDDVRQFLLTRIGSVTNLEILLLLRDNVRDWTAGQVVAELGVSGRHAVSSLESLATSNLVSVRIGNDMIYSYDRKNRDEDLVMRSAETYRRKRAAVVSLMTSPPSPATEFADAFRLRKTEENEP